jgi:pyruvate,orthophosphate dikinase
MAETFIFPFTFGDRTQSDLLGGKGANLAEMVKIGLPVPPGFTITTKACQEFLKSGHSPATLPAELEAAMSALEKELDKEFGNPLKTANSFGAIRCEVFYAWHDGNCSKCGHDARSC